MTGTDYDLWLVVLPIIVSMLAALFLQFTVGWGLLAKRGLVAAVAVAVGVADLWYQGALDLGNLSRTWLVLFVGATAFYDLLWRSIRDATAGGEEEG